MEGKKKKKECYQKLYVSDLQYSETSRLSYCIIINISDREMMMMMVMTIMRVQFPNGFPRCAQINGK